MAMARSVAALLLLAVLVSASAAARSVGGDGVQEACSKTQFPKMCVDSLAAKPESQKATPRKLAELLVTIAAEKGSGMATFVHGKYNGVKDTATLKCYDSCSDDVEEAVAHLNGLLREPTDAKFLELKSWLSSTLGGTSTCEDACKDLAKNADKEDAVSFSLDFEKLLRITLELITEASGSMSADIALPPSDAAAPSSYGAAAQAPAEAPASESEGPAAATPQYGGAASGPAADDAPAPAATGEEASSAPAPSSSDKSAVAPAPSSDASDAPAPSSGDSDSDDNDATA